MTDSKPQPVDIEELYSLAQAAADAEAESVSDDAAALQDFRHTFTPSAVLALIAEVRALRSRLVAIDARSTGPTANIIACVETVREYIGERLDEAQHEQAVGCMGRIAAALGVKL